MYAKSPAAPELPNIDISQIVIPQTMGAYAVYLSAAESNKGALRIADLHAVVDYAGQVVRDLPKKAREANNAAELRDVTLLSHFGRHMSTIVTSKLLSSVTDVSGYEWMPHYIFTTNDEQSGLLIPASTGKPDGSWDVHMAFGEKVADETGYFRTHPLAQVPLSGALCGEGLDRVTTRLLREPRVTVKVDADKLVERATTDKHTTLTRAPWLRVGGYRDEAPRWQETPDDPLPPLIMEIFQADQGRAVLAARQAFKIAVRHGQPLLALEQLMRYGDYLADVDARADHSTIGKLIMQMCKQKPTAIPDELAISAVAHYQDPLQEYKHPRHFAREGDLYRQVAFTRKNTDACRYAQNAYEQAIAHASIDPTSREHVYPDTVRTWEERQLAIKQLEQKLRNKPRRKQKQTGHSAPLQLAPAA